MVSGDTSREPHRLNSVSGFIFDLDGTVYLGEDLLPGAAECIHTLRGRGHPVLFVTNKPLAPRAEYAAKLTRLGIPTCEDQVITSALVLARYLARTTPHSRLYVIGEPYLKDELRGHGLTVVPEPCPPESGDWTAAAGIDAVVVAFDRTLDYRKLNTAYQALSHGARFLATNADKACPVAGGAIPDAGATIAALEHITGLQVEFVAGKPSTLMMQVALEQLGLPADRCLIAGDRLETDVRMGQAAGMLTAVVLTGISTRETVYNSSVRPDLILNNLGELLALLGAA